LVFFPELVTLGHLLNSLLSGFFIEQVDLEPPAQLPSVHLLNLGSAGEWLYG